MKSLLFVLACVLAVLCCVPSTYATGHGGLFVQQRVVQRVRVQRQPVKVVRQRVVQKVVQPVVQPVYNVPLQIQAYSLPQAIVAPVQVVAPVQQYVAPVQVHGGCNLF